MKNIFLCLIVLFTYFLPEDVYSQGLINNGATIVNNGATIYIDGGAGLGNYTNQDAGGFFGKVDNTGFIEVTGNWTNNSTQNVFTGNTGTVELIGTNQNLGGSTTTWFNNLNLLGTGTKTLLTDELTGGGYAVPAGVLSLNDRPLNLNTHTLIVNNPVNTAITRTSGYIISETNSGTNTSILQWNVGALNAAYIFPFGTPAAPNYIPLTITKTGGIADILASTRQTFTSDNQPWHFSVSQMWSQTIPGAGEVPVVVDRWWDINSTAAFNGAVDFTYRGVENTTTYAPSGTFAAQNWIGTSWNLPVGAGPGVLAGTAVVSIPAQALGSTTPWVLSNIDAPLPVKLLYFDAKLDENSVHLDWSTASEINNAFFEVQRSKDNHIFETIDVVEGAGNSTVVLSYKDIDGSPFDGISYYRLRQVDFDGKYSYSETVPVRVGKEKLFEFLFTTPSESRDHLVIGYFSESIEPIAVRIMDVLGNAVCNSVLYPAEGFNKNEIQLPALSGAVYFITLATTTSSISKEFFMN